jgi:protein-disulfide isomerase
MRRTSVVLLALGLAAVTTAGAVALRTTGHAPAPKPVAQRLQLPLPPQGDLFLAERTKGSAKAALTIYEMSDFQCPYCRRQALETFPTLDREFIQTGKVRWIFLNLPLTQLHPNASAAAEFAMCAAKADKFWPVHDLLFAYQEKWAPLKDPGPFLMSLADSAGLPRADVIPCLQSHEMLGLIQAEAEGAAKSGVRSTPTVYIEGAGLLPGAAPVELFRKLLDSLWVDRTSTGTPKQP